MSGGTGLVGYDLGGSGFYVTGSSLRLVLKAQSGDCQDLAALPEPHLRRIDAAAREIKKPGKLRKMTNESICSYAEVPRGI